MEGARGAEDFSANALEAKEEKIEASDTTLSDTKKKPVRGEGK